MINIHITNDNVDLQIKDGVAFHLFSSLIDAVLTVCRVYLIPVDMFAGHLLAQYRCGKGEEK